MQTALIIGVSGAALTPDETQFIRDVKPCGLILFARNCVSREQIRALVAEFRTALGSDTALVLIDQEGGRVQRIRPPVGRTLPPAAAYASLYALNAELACGAARSVARLMADELTQLGIDTNCAPVLDVPVPGAHGIIGDRAYGTSAGQVAALGLAVAEGFLAGGLLPVIKHIPGHGRATCDSHLELPIVTAETAALTVTDFAPFKALSHLPMAMTAHVVFTAIDPGAPASTSEIVVRDIIRRQLGFGGLLMSDDLGMKALSGTMRERAQSVIAAGCDVALHCSGDLAEMTEAAAGVPPLAGAAQQRFDAALAKRWRRDPFDRAAAEAVLAHVLESHTLWAESV
jgi:beta-N-acetylhexosaminidase